MGDVSELFGNCRKTTWTAAGGAGGGELIADRRGDPGGTCPTLHAQLIPQLRGGNPKGNQSQKDKGCRLIWHTRRPVCWQIASGPECWKIASGRLGCDPEGRRRRPGDLFLSSPMISFFLHLSLSSSSFPPPHDCDVARVGDGEGSVSFFLYLSLTRQTSVETLIGIARDLWQ